MLNEYSTYKYVSYILKLVIAMLYGQTIPVNEEASNNKLKVSYLPC